ncbi:MAG: glycerol kinase GlpK [Dehalococcoidales bacterium]|nr:glycerol kinase GlpK [Dehalococcoidales bacterium]
MTGRKYILALDEGTTGCTALLVDSQGRVVSRAYREVPALYPQPGWVEQDPVMLLYTFLGVARRAIDEAAIPPGSVAVLGITGQRETTVVWERETGRPVSNAIVWQCRRTAPLCRELERKGLTDFIHSRTGLMPDAYFSATKLRWILDNIPDGQKRAERGELLFGAIDSWLTWNITRDKLHITDFSNASRTMLFNINTLQWDRELLSLFDIPVLMMPSVAPSCPVHAETTPGLLDPAGIRLGAIIGDQQASLFGHACFKTGMVKNTFGTGSFVLMNTGKQPVLSSKGLITTVAWALEREVAYALEGSIFVTGAAVQWLRDGLNILENAAESEALAFSVEDNAGVYLVPALAGLGAPYWNMDARGTMVGLTRGATRGHIARAALEAMAYQTRDVVEVMENETGIKIPSLRVDGGAAANRFLMQFQADILGIPVECAETTETTALGAACLAGLAAGLWNNLKELATKYRPARIYEPRMGGDERQTLYNGWKRAVSCALHWSNQPGV